MRSQRRALRIASALAVGASLAACDLLIGATDVPLPADGGLDAQARGDATKDVSLPSDATSHRDVTVLDAKRESGNDASIMDARSDVRRKGDAGDAGVAPPAELAVDGGTLFTFEVPDGGRVTDIASADGVHIVWTDCTNSIIGEVVTGDGGTFQLANQNAESWPVKGPESIAVSNLGLVLWSQAPQTELGNLIVGATAVLGEAGVDVPVGGGTGIVSNLVFDDAGDFAFANGYSAIGELEAIACLSLSSPFPACTRITFDAGSPDGAISTQGSSTVALSMGNGVVYGDLTKGQLVDITPVLGIFSVSVTTTRRGTAFGARLVASDGTHAYWIRFTGDSGVASSIVRQGMPFSADAGPAVVLSSSPGLITGLTADVAHVFFTSGDSLYQVPVSGGTATRVATVTGAQLANLKYVASPNATILLFDDGKRIFELTLP